MHRPTWPPASGTNAWSSPPQPQGKTQYKDCTVKSLEAPSRTVPTIGFNLSLSHASTARKQREALEALLGTYFALLTRGGQTVHSALEFDYPSRCYQCVWRGIFNDPATTQSLAIPRNLSPAPNITLHHSATPCKAQKTGHGNFAVATQPRSLAAKR